MPWYGVLRSFTGSVSWAPLTDTQSSLGHYFLGLFWGEGGGGEGGTFQLVLLCLFLYLACLLPPALV